eukprot:7016355-Lingulodinium_polyedra.AAC.1
MYCWPPNRPRCCALPTTRIRGLITDYTDHLGNINRDKKLDWAYRKTDNQCAFRQSSPSSAVTVKWENRIANFADALTEQQMPNENLGNTLQTNAPNT